MQSVGRIQPARAGSGCRDNELALRPPDRFGTVPASRPRNSQSSAEVPSPPGATLARRNSTMILLAVAVSPVLCALGLVQILGIVAAGTARLAEGTRHERSGQWLCLVALAMVGVLCGVSLQFGPDTAAACAVTLALMTLIAIVDFGKR